jgi:hypothetical protein
MDIYKYVVQKLAGRDQRPRTGSVLPHLVRITAWLLAEADEDGLLKCIHSALACKCAGARSKGHGPSY